VDKAESLNAGFCLATFFIAAESRPHRHRNDMKTLFVAFFRYLVFFSYFCTQYINR